MAELNLDDILSDYKGGTPKSKASALDIDAILSDFKTSPLPKDIKKVVINTDPKPPISGISKEASDELNQTRAEKFGGENPRRKLPTTNIVESIGKNFEAGKELMGEALTDAQTGHPYKALGKGALGVLSTVTSPVTGAVEGGIGTPITDITGSKAIGDRAAMVVGSAIPIVPGGSKLVKAFPKNKSLSELVDNIGQENLPAVVEAMKRNPRLGPADLSPTVLQTTQNLFTQEGKHIDYLANTSGKRMSTAKEAVETAYDEATGMAVNAVEKLKELKKAADDVGSKEINPAIATAKPVDVTPVLDHIDNALKPGVNKILSVDSTLPSSEINAQLKQVRSILANTKEQRTDANSLHTVQSILRGTADTLLNSADGQARRMGHALMNVRNELVKAIDKAADGKYKPALSNYRDAKQIDDAFHEGYNSIFTNSKKIEGRPEFTKQWFEGLSDAEKAAAREGARLQLDTQINNFRFSARKGMEIPEVDFNRQKLEMLFGKAETDKLVTALKDERAIANTHNKVIEGSQTAMRAATKEQTARPVKGQVGQGLLMGAGLETANILAHGYPGVGSATLLGANVLNSAKHKVKMRLAKEKDAQYARYALPTEGPSRDELIRALEARISTPKPSMLARGANTLSRIVAP